MSQLWDSCGNRSWDNTRLLNVDGGPVFQAETGVCWDLYSFRKRPGDSNNVVPDQKHHRVSIFIFYLFHERVIKYWLLRCCSREFKVPTARLCITKLGAFVFFIVDIIFIQEFRSSFFFTICTSYQNIVIDTQTYIPFIHIRAFNLTSRGMDPVWHLSRDMPHVAVSRSSQNIKRSLHTNQLRGGVVNVSIPRTILYTEKITTNVITHFYTGCSVKAERMQQRYSHVWKVFILHLKLRKTIFLSVR